MKTRSIPPRAALLAALLAALAPGSATIAADAAAPEKSTTIARATVAPTIDGALDEAVWADAVIVSDLYQIDPREFAAPSEATEFLLLYTEDALYIGARVFDSQPDQIHAKVLRQGGRLRSEDRVKVVLDPFHDKRSGYGFMINPNGVRLDGIFKGTEYDSDWDGIWQGEAQIVADGWTAEFRIPFKSLSFNQSDVWGLNFIRELPRLQEKIAWSSRNRAEDPAVAGTLTGMTAISQGSGLDIVPSISSTTHRDYDPTSNQNNTEPSLDIFYKLTTGLNGSLTFNTDFSATEVDNRQVNLTRFNLFFPEKRSFFLRESDIFEFGGIGGDDRDSTLRRGDNENGRPYFSRRIGLSATGQPVDIDYGGKVSGRIGDWNVGVMAIQLGDFETVDAATIAVARVTRNVLEESNVGFMVTNGDPRSNFDNSLIGVDYQYRNSRLAEGRRLDANFWYQQTDTEGFSGNNVAYGFDVTSPNRTGWRGAIGAREVQQNFMPAVGFVSRNGVRQYSTEVGYTYQKNGTLIRSIYSGIDAQRFDHIDGGLDSQRVVFRLMELKSNSADDLILRYEQQQENLLESFEIIEGVIIPTGEYSFGATKLEFKSSEDRPVNLELALANGDFFDGTIQSAVGKVGWRPSKYFRLGASLSVDDVELPQEDFTTRLASADFEIVFSNTIAWVNLIQYDNISDSIGVNSRVHWTPQAGQNFYFVVNHNYKERLDDRSFHSTSTDLTLKFDYTFRF